MNELEEEICHIVRKRLHCLCGIRPPYCKVVVDLFNLMLEELEKEAT